MKIDFEEFNKFFDILPEVDSDETFFISLSARNKYLTDEERDKYALGKTEMFGREIIYQKNIENFKTVFLKLESTLSYRFTNNGSRVPEKCLVVYMNLNPTSTFEAVSHFQKEMNGVTRDYVKGLKRGNDVDVFEQRFKNAQGILRTQMQKYTSRKLFADIDIDCKDQRVLDMVVDFLEDHECKYFVIETHGGWHIPVLISSLRANKCNYVSVINDANKFIKENGVCKMNGKPAEVENNTNHMIPVPGTYQANFLVKMLYCNITQSDYLTAKRRPYVPLEKELPQCLKCKHCSLGPAKPCDLTGGSGDLALTIRCGNKKTQYAGAYGEVSHDFCWEIGSGEVWVDGGDSVYDCEHYERD